MLITNQKELGRGNTLFERYESWKFKNQQDVPISISNIFFLFFFAELNGDLYENITVKPL